MCHPSSCSWFPPLLHVVVVSPFFPSFPLLLVLRLPFLIIWGLLTVSLSSFSPGLLSSSRPCFLPLLLSLHPASFSRCFCPSPCHFPLSQCHFTHLFLIVSPYVSPSSSSCSSFLHRVIAIFVVSPPLSLCHHHFRCVTVVVIVDLPTQVFRL